MATKSFKRILFRSPVWRQNETATWDGISDAYIQSFINSGCFLCALTMIAACMENNTTMKPYKLIERGVATATDPSIISYSKVSSSFSLETKQNNFIANIAEAVVGNNVPVMIQVPGHAVVAYGYVGNMTNTSGEPQYSTADASAIRIFDPYKGRYDDNLEGLISSYGAITKIRIPS